MSKAFTKEGDGDAEPAPVSHRPALAAGVSNYVTRRGLLAMRRELATVIDQMAAEAAAPGAPGGEPDRVPRWLKSRRRELEAHLASAVPVDRQTIPPDDIRFGAVVDLRSAEGVVRHYEIVGIDEADAAVGRVAFVSPLARALLGRRAGDTVTVRTPGGDEDLEVLSIAYDAEDYE